MDWLLDRLNPEEPKWESSEAAYLAGESAPPCQATYYATAIAAQPHSCTRGIVSRIWPRCMLDSWTSDRPPHA